MITCDECDATEFQHLREESVGSVRYIDTKLGTVSEWFPNDEPGYVEESWFCVNGHVASWDNENALTLIVAPWLTLE